MPMPSNNQGEDTKLDPTAASFIPHVALAPSAAQTAAEITKYNETQTASSEIPPSAAIEHAAEEERTEEEVVGARSHIHIVKNYKRGPETHNDGEAEAVATVQDTKVAESAPISAGLAPTAADDKKENAIARANHSAPVSEAQPDYGTVVDLLSKLSLDDLLRLPMDIGRAMKRFADPEYVNILSEPIFRQLSKRYPESFINKKDVSDAVHASLTAENAVGLYGFIQAKSPFRMSIMTHRLLYDKFKIVSCSSDSTTNWCKLDPDLVWNVHHDEQVYAECTKELQNWKLNGRPGADQLSEDKKNTLGKWLLMTYLSLLVSVEESPLLFLWHHFDDSFI